MKIATQFLKDCATETARYQSLLTPEQLTELARNQAKEAARLFKAEQEYEREARLARKLKAKEQAKVASGRAGKISKPEKAEKSQIIRREKT